MERSAKGIYNTMLSWEAAQAKDVRSIERKRNENI